MTRPLLIFAVLALALTAMTTAQTVNRTGFLADHICIDRRIALDGADMLLRPQDHSIMCNLLTVCVQSGYLILEAPTPGTTPTAYGTMWNFTSAANFRAVAYMRTLSTSRKNLMVTATGTMVGGLFDAQEFVMVPSGSVALSTIAASIAVLLSAALALV